MPLRVNITPRAIGYAMMAGYTLESITQRLGGDLEAQFLVASIAATATLALEAYFPDRRRKPSAHSRHSRTP